PNWCCSSPVFKLDMLAALRFVCRFLQRTRAFLRHKPTAESSRSLGSSFRALSKSALCVAGKLARQIHAYGAFKDFLAFFPLAKLARGVAEIEEELRVVVALCSGLLQQLCRLREKPASIVQNPQNFGELGVVRIGQPGLAHGVKELGIVGGLGIVGRALS